MIYEYYSSFPVMKYTLLTSAAKSVVAWHMFYTASSYGYVIFSSLFLEDLKNRWETDGNITCYQNPAGLKLVFYPVTAILEFQILRLTFEAFPYRFLDMNHDLLAYPMAISVPVLALLLKIFIYIQQGTLCSVGPEMILHFKLNLDISKTKTYFSDNRIDNLVYLLIIIFEAFIRICRFCKRGKSTQRRNKVGVANPRAKEAWIEPESTQNKQETTLSDVKITIENEPTTNLENKNTKHETTIGPIAPMFFFATILWLLYKFVSKEYYLSSVYYDCLLLGLPFYWILSSNEIIKYLKLKFCQFKTNLGFV